MKEIRLPKFIESYGADSGMEALHDFFICWTIRCADAVYENSKYAKLHKISKQILFAMIFGENAETPRLDKAYGEKFGFALPLSIPNDFHFSNIESFRQKERVDILAKVSLTTNNTEQVYILNIENKYYYNSKLEQLLTYKHNIALKFQKDNLEIINILLLPDHSKKEITKALLTSCQKEEIKIVTIFQLQNTANIFDIGTTGNYLFDEFWFETY
jgi:hypothetical protein